MIEQDLVEAYFECNGFLVRQAPISSKPLKNKKKLPIYKVISKSGPDHDPLFTIKVLIDEDISSFAEGKSKQDAEINAANKLLKEICE